MATKISIQSLEQAQELLRDNMEDVEKIWGQLNSDPFRKGFDSQGEYESWRVRASDAYNHKRTFVKELLDYVEMRFAVRYKTLLEVTIAINERTPLEAPDWLSAPSVTSVTETQAVEEVPETLEIILSGQSELQYAKILHRLAEARNAANITQAEAAAYFGYHATAVGQWERGKTPITLLNIFKLANIYETDPLYILTGERSITQDDIKIIAQSLKLSLDGLYMLLGSE